MNGASPEMRPNRTAGNRVGSGTVMSVLERQRARMKWQQQEQIQHQQSYFSEQLGDLIDSDRFVPRVVKPDPGLENGWQEYGSGFGSCELGNNIGSGFEMNYGISRTLSCPPAVAAAAPAASESGLPEKLSAAAGRESFKKRKTDKSLNLKAIAEENAKEKRNKGCAEEGESKITYQNTSHAKNKSSNGETSADTSKDNSKVSEDRKLDYIHVRARRGQATDSHSLAERVRREKISERMKYLQDLVPGCNKITGKAGMLDEIINYVQSLQRQVEFLSMKLATVNPGAEFNIENLFPKEMFPNCTSIFPTIGVSSSEMANSAYLQFSQLQQLVSCCEMEMGISPPDAAIRRTISAPNSIPETFLDSSSCFNQIQPSSNWDADFLNLYTTPFPTQQYSDSNGGSSLKMEM